MQLINFQNNQTKLNKAMFDEFQNNIKEAIDAIYPVGSIYMSVNDVNPGTLFGGSWEQIKDRFLLGCGDSYQNGSTGGESMHKLTIDEMPSHTHGIYSQSTETPNNKGWVARAINGYDTTQTMGCIIDNGGNQPHNNMPPYLAVYIWKRIS